MREGISVAIDAGGRRIGVARCDVDRTLALPVTTVHTDRYGSHIDELIDILREIGAVDIFVGLPAHLSGAEGASAQAARRLATALWSRTGLPTRMVDERLTTVQAHAALNDAGRPTRSRKSVIDQVAAVILLEHVLESERRTGEIPGRLVK